MTSQTLRIDTERAGPPKMMAPPPAGHGKRSSKAPNTLLMPSPIMSSDGGFSPALSQTSFIWSDGNQSPSDSSLDSSWSPAEEVPSLSSSCDSSPPSKASSKAQTGFLGSPLPICSVRRSPALPTLQMSPGEAPATILDDLHLKPEIKGIDSNNNNRSTFAALDAPNTVPTSTPSLWVGAELSPDNKTCITPPIRNYHRSAAARAQAQVAKEQDDALIVVGKHGGMRLHTLRAQLLSDATKSADYELWVPFTTSLETDADILYLSDDCTPGELPDLALPFIRQGYRIIVPLFGKSTTSNNAVEFGIEHRVACIAAIVANVRDRDSNTKTCKFAPMHKNPQPVSNNTDESDNSQVLKTLRQLSTGKVNPTKSAIKHKSPVYALGVGYGGLVAAHYAVLTSPYVVGRKPPPTPTSPAFSPSSSFGGNIRRANTWNDTWGKLRSTKLGRSLSVRETAEPPAPMPSPPIQGLILMSSVLDYETDFLAPPSSNGRASLSQSRGPVSPMSYTAKRSPSLQSVYTGSAPTNKMVRESIEKLAIKATAIRIPTFFMHGVLDPTSSAKAVMSLYHLFGAQDKTAAIYQAVGSIKASSTEVQEAACLEGLRWLEARRAPPTGPKGRVQFINVPDDKDAHRTTSFEQQRLEADRMLAEILGRRRGIPSLAPSRRPI